MGFQKLELDYNKATATLDSNGSNVTATKASSTSTTNLSLLFDGGYPSTNSIDFENSNADFTIEYDFGEDNKQYLGDILIQFGGGKQATAYTIQLSEDGTNYTTVHTVTSDPGGEISLRIHGAGNEPGIQNGTTAVAYRKFKFNFTAFINNECRIREINVYTVSLDELSFKDYNVEFDDALLDLEGWKNPRFEGSKLTGVRRNQYVQGDVSYGLNPVIEHKTACIFLGKDVDEGAAGDIENVLVDIQDHSYITIEKILIVDLDSDDIEIIARENTIPSAFNRIVAENFPEGSNLIFKNLDTDADKLKNSHFVKFNRGKLMKIYTYIPNTDGHEDGVFGGFGIHEGKEDKTTEGATTVRSLSGSGLFGFGQTTVESRSLFNTNSIRFNAQLPTELSAYIPNYSTETMGSSLADITASADLEFFMGGGPGSPSVI